MRIPLPEAEFYITNACNFNCPGCNRFNNVNFSGPGHKWADYAELYEKWANIVDIQRWTIMGGEPMMNNGYLDWVDNISRLWPNAQGRLLTNGYFLRAENRSLYDILKRSQGQVRLIIGLHNSDRKQQILDVVNSWLVGDVTVQRIPNNLRQLPHFDQHWTESYNLVRDQSWPDCDTVDDWHRLPDHVKKECHEIHGFSPELLSETRKGWLLIDSNGVTVNIEPEDHFHQNAMIMQPSGLFALHQSDPVKAHDICDMKTCHHFIRGKLYKCGVIGVLPEFDKEFELEISQQDRDLLHSYKPATADMDPKSLEKFITDLDRPIDQCKFCPENYEIKRIFAQHGKKGNFIKRHTPEWQQILIRSKLNV